MQLLVNNDYEHTSISTMGKRSHVCLCGIIAVCYLSSLMNLIIDGSGWKKRRTLLTNTHTKEKRERTKEREG